MVRAKLNIGCRYSTPVRVRPLHPTRCQFKPEASQTQAPVTPATEPERRAGGGLTTLPGATGEQEFAAAFETDEGPILALATTRQGHGVGEAAVVRGEHARKGLVGLEESRDILEVPSECVGLLLAAALAEGLDSGRLAPGGLIDVAVAGGLAELRPRAMTVQDWLDELDPDREIAGLAPPERELLVEESEAWPERHPAVEAWSEGTAIYRAALRETRSGEKTEVAFWSLMERRRVCWAQTMLRAAYVLKNAGERDWRSFAATAMALLAGRSFEAVPIMDRIYVETVAATAREELGRLSEGDDGSAELDRLVQAAAWPEDADAVAESIWLDGYLAAAVLAPSEVGPGALYSAAVERFTDGGECRTDSMLGRMTKRYDTLQNRYGKTREVAAMFLAAEDIGMTEWARGFAQGVAIMQTAWPTERFVAEERQMLSLLARLAEGELAEWDECADVLTFVEWRWQVRYSGWV